MSRTNITQARFAELFERETRFYMMDRDGRTAKEHIEHNIQCFRDWAAETAERLEGFAQRVPAMRNEPTKVLRR